MTQNTNPQNVNAQNSHPQNTKLRDTKPRDTKPISIGLTGQSGQRVVLNTARRVLREHQKEIKALADK